MTVVKSRVPRVIVASLVLVAGCNWISLGANALTYETLKAGEAGNIVVADTLAYVTLGDSGVGVLDARSGRRIGLLAPPAGLESVDDIALAEGILFLLDARKPGHVATAALSGALIPTRAHDVSVGPFSGISAARGLCIVSGGTSALTFWRYSPTGALTLADSTDLGRGQPDVAIDASGRRAFVSTHYWGPYFGLNVLALPALSETQRVELDGAGFTSGGAKPANFPIEVAQLSENVVLVAHARGVAVVDVAAGRVNRVVDVGGPAVSIDVREHEAAVAVAGPAPAVVFLDFAGATERVVRRVALDAGTKPAGVAFSGDNVLVAARDRGVLVVQR